MAGRANLGRPTWAGDPQGLRRFREALLAWYRENRRDLPWRRTRDPYAILVSEVLLQQTRVEQALGYYARFLAAFPDFAALARAPEEEVLGIWAGAGYYRRAQNLHRLAQRVAAEGLPRTSAGLLGLPGIGPYTAAAVASVAFGEPVAVVDGNVRRVLARLLAARDPRPRALRATAQALLDPADPGTWNQALMELGSLVCTPRDPKCACCPVASFCAGKGEPTRYPAPRRRAQRRAEAVALVLVGGTAFWAGFGASPWPRVRRPSPRSFPGSASRKRCSWARCGTPFPTSASPWRCTGPPGRGPTEAPGKRPLSSLDRKILALVARPTP